MSDDYDIALVRKFLEKAGCEVERLPAPNDKKYCDLRADDGDEKYLIEVKSFHDDATIQQTLRNGDIHEGEHRHTYRDSVAKEIREAIKQLQSTAEECGDALWLVALIARSKNDASFMFNQIIGTLYGVGAITDCGPDGGSRRRRCLYFYDSAFYRHRELDGALVLDSKSAVLCMNDYGRRLDRVRQSGLACFLAQHKAFYDMATWERDFDCLVADFKMDRADRPAVLERLKQKYPGRKLLLMNWYRYEGLGAIPL
jgi:CheY-like chemotaxis protein